MQLNDGAALQIVLISGAEIGLENEALRPVSTVVLSLPSHPGLRYIIYISKLRWETFRRGHEEVACFSISLWNGTSRNCRRKCFCCTTEHSAQPVLVGFVHFLRFLVAYISL